VVLACSIGACVLALLGAHWAWWRLLAAAIADVQQSMDDDAVPVAGRVGGEPPASHERTRRAA
jgi:hypothetical protein